MSAVPFPCPPAGTISSRPYITFLFLTVALFLCASVASAQCTPNPTNNTLTICTPLNNQTVSSPFTVSAVATSSAAVTKFLVYLDSVLKFQQLNTKSISTSLTAAARIPQPHRSVLQRGVEKGYELHYRGIQFWDRRDGQPKLCDCSYRRNATIHSCGYGYFEYCGDVGRRRYVRRQHYRGYHLHERSLYRAISYRNSYDHSNQRCRFK